jgi:elongation factor Tu
MSSKGFPIMTYPDRTKARQGGSDPQAVWIDYETQNRHYGLSDCPGHADYVNTMILGATQMDVAILVVSAPDGPMPQTKEHVIIAKQLGIPNIVVFLNKCDQLSDDEMLELVEQEVREVLTMYGFDGGSAPFVHGSGKSALEGPDPAGVYTNAVIKLMEVCDSMTIPNREVGKPFMLPINAVYDIAGVGTVVAGIIKQGTINVSEGLAVSGYGQSKTKTSDGLQMFKKTVATGMAGDKVGVLLSGLKKADIKRGQVLCKPGMVHSVKNFEVEVYILTQAEGGRHKPFCSGYSPQFHFNNIAITGSVKIPSGWEQVMPGDRTTLEVELTAPVPIEAGLGIIMRDNSRTIGTGTVTKITTSVEILTAMEDIGSSKGSSKGKMSKSDIIFANCRGRVYPLIDQEVFGSVASDDMQVLKFKTNNPAAGPNPTMQKGHYLCPVVIDDCNKACLPSGYVATAKPWYYMCCIHRWWPFADLKQQDKTPLDGAVDASPLLITYAGRGIGGCDNDY